ncbi:hypothetical protein [Cupriavidus sp. D39]|uniref:hypothetical protein n=1 Tax=Cupriavidus sp. D39 TaxID=2997877 RepID=UPI0022716890|nr:hypothetical protein [Cupriavidus sp. D39]MCY0853087.1 hypothetical protein [Cupriavidus sp. D39]
MTLKEFWKCFYDSGAGLAALIGLLPLFVALNNVRRATEPAWLGVGVAQVVASVAIVVYGCYVLVRGERDGS